MSIASREVYPSPPLVVVSIELRFGYEPRLNLRETRDAFATRVQPLFAILEEEVSAPSVVSDIASTVAAGGGIPQVRATTIERDISVALSARSLSVIVAGHRYRHFEELLEILVPVFQHLVEVVPEVRAERLGLRYIDEIRLPVDSENSADWTQWINPALIGAAAILEPLPSVAVYGKSAFATSKNQRVELQWGDAFGRTMVAGSSPIKVPEVSEAQFFAIDIDSFWFVDSPELVTAGLVEDTLLALHEPIRRVFEWSITEAARTEFRKASE